MAEGAKHMRVEEVPVDDSSSPWKSVGLVLLMLLGSGVAGVALCLLSSALAHGGVVAGWFNRFWFAFFFVTSFVAALLLLGGRFGKRPEVLYLLIAVMMTALFSWSFSLRTAGWDVGVHYRNILVFADWEGDVELTQADAYVVDLSPLDTGEGAVLQTLNEREDAVDAATAQNRVVERKSNPVWYVTSIEYIPYALVLRLCRALGVSFSRTLFLLRLTGGLFYAFVTFLGMRKLRTGKMLYAVIALLPTSVFLASELGYSYWLFSLCLYGFASLVGMLQQNVEVSGASVAKMLGALLLGMLPRVVYFPLMFLCLLIPTELFPSDRFARAYRLLLVGAALLALGVWLVPRLVENFGGGDARGGEVDPAAQVAYILTHPLEYANTVVRFVMPPLAMEDGGADVEGVNLVSGFLSVEATPGLLVNYGYYPRAHRVFTLCLWGIILLVTITDKDHDDRTGWLAGIVSLMLCACVAVMIITALYLEFTPVGMQQIHGVQRRYLLPLLFPLLAFFGPHVFGLRGRVPDGPYNLVVLASMGMVLLGSWWMSCVGLIV